MITIKLTEDVDNLYGTSFNGEDNSVSIVSGSFSANTILYYDETYPGGPMFSDLSGSMCYRVTEDEGFVQGRDSGSLWLVATGSVELI